MSIERIAVEETWPVRLSAFAALGSLHGGRNESDDDSNGLHWAVRVGGELVAVTSLFSEPSPVSDFAPSWRVRGMATLPGHQSHGYGGRLLQASVDHVAGRGGGLVWANLRLAAIPFYERHGFVAQGDVFKTASGTDHRYGDRMVPTSPSIGNS